MRALGEKVSPERRRLEREESRRSSRCQIGAHRPKNSGEWMRFEAAVDPCVRVIVCLSAEGWGRSRSCWRRRALGIWPP